MTSPVIINLHGDEVTFVKGQGAVAIDAAGTGNGDRGVAPLALGLSDSDSANFNGGNLAARIVTGIQASEDVLKLDTSLVTLSGGDSSPDVGETVSVGGFVIGTIATDGDGKAGNDLVIDLNTNATPARVEILAQALQYENTNTDFPDATARIVRVTVNDGGETSANNDVTVNVNLPSPGAYTDTGQALGNSNSAGVAAGDIDGDGDIDVVVGNDDNQANRVYFNDGAGTFTAGAQSIGSSATLGVVLGDVDGDGDLDMVTANVTSDKLWLNDGSGNFTDSGQTLGSEYARANVMGDIDGDGDLDVIAANNGVANKVYVNDGSGTFTDSGQTLGGAAASFGVALGDLDGDGDLDLFEVNEAGQADKVYLNDGSGTFTDTGQSLGASNSRDVKLGDLDNDGDLDAYVTHYGQTDAVWLNDGTGTFTLQAQTLGAWNNTGVALVDSDADGDLDAVLATYNGGENKFLVNDGAGNFTDSGQSPSGGATSHHRLAVADFDRDGDFDVFSARHQGNANKVYLNGADPVITNLDGDRVTFTKGQGAIQIDAAGTGTDNHGFAPLAAGLSDPDSTSFDGGRLNISIVSGQVAGEDVLTLDNAIVTLSGGDSSPDAGETVTVDGVVIGTIATGGDGKGGNDLQVVLNSDATVARVQTLIQAVQYENTNSTDPDTEPRTVQVQLYDGGGGTSAANDVTVNISVPAAGTFIDSGQRLGTSNTVDVALGDIDGDGDLDALCVNNGANSRVWLNNGSAVFSDSGQSLSGTNGNGAAFADVDADGDLDALIGSGGTTAVYLNNGLGVFTDSGQSLSTGNVSSVSVADLDGDGDIDFYASNSFGADRYYLNDGSGTFALGGSLGGSNDYTDEAALGDLDGDGDIDAYDLHGGLVWQNDGSATFSRFADVYEGVDRGAIGDLDGDGDLDAVAVRGSSTKILLNDGSGGFSNAQTLTSDNAEDVALGDVDGDGDLDIFSVNGNYFTPRQDRVWLNDGSGNFSDSGQLLSNDSGGSVALGDLDGDGDLDAFVGNLTAYGGTGQNHVWLNASAAPEITNLDGDRVTFTKGQGAINIDAAGTGTDNHGMAPLAAGLSDADSADFDGGNLTVTIASGEVAAEDLLIFDTSGTVSLAGTTAGSNVSVGGTVVGTLANDIDEGNDLVVNLNGDATPARVQILIRAVQYDNTNATDPDTGPRTVRLTVNDGDGGTSAASDVTVNVQVPATGVFTHNQNLGSAGSFSVAVGDIDGDGDLDAFVGNLSGGDRVWLNDGAGTFTDSLQSLGSSDSRSVALGDLDGDGDLDAFVGNKNSNANLVWLNDGAGAFTGNGQSLGNNNSFAVSLGDVDGDGDLDAWVANNGANKVWLNDGTGTFTDSGQSLDSVYSYGVALGDVDGDGDLDAYAANWQSGNRVWLNDGAGNFTDSIQSLGSYNSTFVAFGDIDGDGDIDAFVTNQDEANRVWLNDGNGAFADSGQTLGASSSQEISLADVDGDGDLDAVVANWNQGNRVWLNDGAGNFTDSSQALGSYRSYGVAVGDLDMDGDIDGIFANDGQHNTVWLNDQAPVITNLDGDSLAYSEGAGAVVVDRGTAATVADVDSADFNGGTLRVSIASGGDAAEDVLAIRNQGTGAGQIGVSGLDVTYGGTVIGTFAGGTSGADLVVTLNGDATPAATQALAQNITYANTDPDAPTEGARSIRFVLSDGDGGTSANSDVTVTVSGVNDAPAIINLDGDRVTFSKGQGAVHIDAAGTGTDNHGVAPLAAGLSDVDSTDFNGGTLTVTITSGEVATEDLLTFDTSGTVSLAGTTAGSNVSVGATVVGTLANDIDEGNDLVVNLNGDATPARVQILIRAVQYDNTNATDPDTGPRTVQLTVNDGDGGTSAVSDVTVSVLRETGGTFSLRQDLDLVRANVVVVGDVDRDGDLDVFAPNPAANSVFLNDGYGAFSDSGQALGSSNSINAALGDLDGDGDLDAYVANFYSGGYLPDRVWLNDGNGVFTDSGQMLGASMARAVSLGDLDGDGDLDAFVANENSTGISRADQVWFNDGSGVFTDSGQLLGSEISFDVALGDLDGDGDLDAYVANAYPGNDRVWFNDGSGTFVDGGHTEAIENSQGVALGDVDGDGDLDAVIAATDVHGAANQVLLNDGTGTFTNSGQDLGTFGSLCVALGDADGDGDLDAVFGNDFNADTNVFDPGRLYLNDGSGVFTDSGQDIGNGDSRLLSLPFADVNADGDLDLLVGHDTYGLKVWQKSYQPSIDNLDGDSFGYVEGDGAVTLDQDTAATVTDLDSANFDTGTLTVSFVSGVDVDEDVLAIRNQGTGVGEIGVSGFDVTYEGTVIGTFAGGIGGADLIVTFNANATPAIAGVLVQNITYENTDTVDPTSGTNVVSFVLTDGDGDSTASNEVTFSVYEVNSVPDFTGLDATPGYSEGAAPVVLDGDATVSDTELDAAAAGNGNYDGATLTVLREGGANADDDFSFAAMTHVTVNGGNLEVAGEGGPVAIATFTNVGGTLTVSFTDANGQVPTTALVNEILQAVSYQNNAISRPEGGTEDVTLIYSLHDGTEAGSDSLTVTVTGTDGDDYLTGTPGDDSLASGIGNDTIDALAGNDTLNGGTGADSLIGGPGNDTYVVDDAGDTVNENASEGTDTVQTTRTSHTLGAHIENLTGTLTTGQALTGNGLGNVLTGAAGNDTLNGLAGNDTLNGGTGADSLTGSTGDDIYVVDNAGDSVTENSGEGTDEVQTGLAAYTLGDHVENLTGTSAVGQTLNGNDLANTITGVAFGGNDVINGFAGNDSLFGDDSADTLNGGSGQDYIEGGNFDNAADSLSGDDDDDTLDGGGGNDTLDGGTGADSLIGSAGDDTYVVDDVGDTVNENTGEGTDEVRTGLAAYTLDDHVENLTGTSVAGQTLTGNAAANALTGNSGNDTLNGGDGNDTLNGGDGNDKLDGGAGADNLSGGAGNDLFTVDDSGDKVFGGSGIDKVNASKSFSLGNDVENLALTGHGNIKGTGNGMANTITGNGGRNKLSGANGNDSLVGGNGNDTLDGGSGKDTMKGGSGNDVFAVDHSGDKVFGGSGSDKVNASKNFSLGNDVENLTLTGGGNIDGTGNNKANTLIGNGGKNVMKGSGGKDEVSGGGGNDTVKGGSGNDTVKGDGGGDKLAGDGGNDRIIGGSGTDTAIFKGGIGRYTVTKIAGGKIKVVDKKGAYGTDILSGVEKLKFGSKVYKIKEALKSEPPHMARADDDDLVKNSINDDILFGERYETADRLLTSFHTEDRFDDAGPESRCVSDIIGQFLHLDDLFV